MANDITTENQEMGGAKKLSKSAIRRAYWDWMFYNLSVQNFERMQGPAIIKMLADVREDLYPGNPEAQQEMLGTHVGLFQAASLFLRQDQHAAGLVSKLFKHANLLVRG